MSQTKFSIASQGFVLDRANPVSSFDEGSNEANIATEFYDAWARNVLSLHPWSFCRIREQFIRSGKTQPGWKYLYVIPPTALRVFAVYNSGQENAPPVRHFEVVADGDGQYIACNEEQVFGLYTFYATEAVWPGWFVEFAKYSWAALVAIPVSDDEGLENQMSVRAFGSPSEGGKGGKFAQAAMISDQQSPPQQYRENEIIAARFS